MTYVALVIGSTGAVGRDLVAELVASAKCAKVIALTRREIPESKWATAFPALDVAQAQSKLEIRAVEFDQLASGQVLIKPDEKVDAAFSCLGTTRKGAFMCPYVLWSVVLLLAVTVLTFVFTVWMYSIDAGSVEAFRKGARRILAAFMCI